MGQSGNRGGELVVVAFAVADVAAGAEGGLRRSNSSRAASTSQAVILPNGLVPAMDSMFTLCCFASFLAYDVATVFPGPSCPVTVG
ncbi:unnamed protein product [Cochlearia groenlandica]